MPTIAFVSPKGGTGKTTSALLLAIFLSRLYDVTVIDADPNHPIKDFAEGGNCPARLNVIAEEEEDNIIERMEEAAAKTPFVIVDLEGTASKMVVYAISQSDFVIIPTQASPLDAKAASRAVRVILQSEKMTKTKKAYAVLLTRTNPMIRSRGLVHIQKSLIEAGIPVLETELNEREAYRAILSFNQTLDDLPQDAVSNLDKARLNIAELAHEVITRIVAEQNGGEKESGEKHLTGGVA